MKALANVPMVLSTFMLLHEAEYKGKTKVSYSKKNRRRPRDSEQGDICTLLDSLPLFFNIRMEISYG